MLCFKKDCTSWSRDTICVKVATQVTWWWLAYLMVEMTFKLLTTCCRNLLKNLYSISTLAVPFFVALITFHNKNVLRKLPYNGLLMNQKAVLSFS